MSNHDIIYKCYLYNNQIMIISLPIPPYGEINMNNAEEKLFDDLCECFKGFEQFRNHPDNYEIKFMDLKQQTCYFDVRLKHFEGIDKKEINRYVYGPVDGTYYRNIEGSISSGSPDYVYIRFKADSRSMVKIIMGHLSDGPNTTLLPDTLGKVLYDHGIDQELISTIMDTVHSQSNTSYNDGWVEARELYKNKE